MVGIKLEKDDIVVYESTVYPGVTRQVLNPIIEKYSKKKLNQNYYLGYSPERINPGDKYSDIKIEEVLIANIIFLLILYILIIP